MGGRLLCTRGAYIEHSHRSAFGSQLDGYLLSHA
jgi:hypothetical protein